MNARERQREGVRYRKNLQKREWVRNNEREDHNKSTWEYAVCRIIEIMKRKENTCSGLLNPLRSGVLDKKVKGRNHPWVTLNYRFRQAQLGWIRLWWLSFRPNRFSLIPQLPLKMTLAPKVVKILPQKSTVTHNSETLQISACFNCG